MSLFGKNKKRGAPTFGNENVKTLHQNLEFIATEQYKLIRANLDFTLPDDEKCPIIGVTSSMRGEGKSTTAVNLSYVIAEKGSRVLLIDADLRLPSIAKKLSLDGSFGLSDLLRNSNADLTQMKSYLLDNWYVLPSGSIPPNPSELLGSKRMRHLLQRLREAFDYIIIDLPPVNIVSDALSVANNISGMIVVIREEYTEKKELERCFRQLRLSNVNVLGCVMNSSMQENGRYGKYKYRKYKYYKYYREYRSSDEGVTPS